MPLFIICDMKTSLFHTVRELKSVRPGHRSVIKSCAPQSVSPELRISEQQREMSRAALSFHHSSVTLRQDSVCKSLQSAMLLSCSVYNDAAKKRAMIQLGGFSTDDSNRRLGASSLYLRPHVCVNIAITIWKFKNTGKNALKD